MSNIVEWSRLMGQCQAWCFVVDSRTKLKCTATICRSTSICYTWSKHLKYFPYFSKSLVDWSICFGEHSICAISKGKKNTIQYNTFHTMMYSIPWQNYYKTEYYHMKCDDDAWEHCICNPASLFLVHSSFFLSTFILLRRTVINIDLTRDKLKDMICFWVSG